MPISLRQIRYFVAAAEIGQVSQAANHLHISQSAVTSAIQELERILEVQLFIRSAQGMQLTDSGRHFLHHAYSILGAVADALNSPMPKNDVAGVLHVAASYTVMGYVLPYHLKRIAQLYPNLTIRLYEQSHEQIKQGLLAGVLDMSLVATANICADNIITETLYNSSRRLWVSSDHHLANVDTVSFQDIADEPYIILNVDEAEQVAEKYWQRHKHTSNIILNTISIEAVRSMVGNGLGITILSDMIYRPWSLEGKRIVTKTLKDSIPSLSIGLAWAKDMPLTPHRRCFQEYFRRTCLVPQLMSSR